MGKTFVSILEENQKLASLDDASAFFNALRAGDLETFRRMATSNPRILQWQNPNFPGILHQAAEGSTIPIVEYLLSLGYDVNARDVVHNLDYTPLWFAARRMNRDSREAMVRFLIQRGANANAGAGQHATPLHNVTRHESPELIHLLIEHGADPRFEDEEGQTPLALAIENKCSASEAALRERGAPLIGLPIEGRVSKKAKYVRIDLRRDATKVRAYITKRVGEQKKRSPDAPVKLITLGFDYAHSGFVALHFDTRPDADVDGEWGQYVCEIELKMPQWGKAGEVLGEKPVHLILLDTSKLIVPVGDEEFEFAVVAGDMLKNTLLAARSEGAFASLCKAERCELAVEHMEGYYGWPAHEDRGKENLI